MKYVNDIIIRAFMNYISGNKDQTLLTGSTKRIDNNIKVVDDNEVMRMLFSLRFATYVL